MRKPGHMICTRIFDKVSQDGNVGLHFIKWVKHGNYYAGEKELQWRIISRHLSVAVDSYEL